ncbi:hypothetical protein HPB52_001615 [Rhipicephalus sanguineus]|uniref:PiggyBac transposable element-derived protein domain-containing protein n=1 Tax=Rhipicephalus sanguineus TaxID=34632 RepID=A0A9D4SRQ9_RHISA|nr:hypothetical protein HPB52_001615 [Rhipicephalus sanguineus]
MADELPVDVRHLPFHFYFDNLFTSLHLLRHLKEKNYEATGTVRQNRVPKECPIARPDFIKRKTRGYEEHALSDDGIIIVRWMDNSVVTIASTVHGVEPMSSADRHARREPKSEGLDCVVGASLSTGHPPRMNEPSRRLLSRPRGPPGRLGSVTKRGTPAMYEYRNTCKYFDFDAVIDLLTELWKHATPKADGVAYKMRGPRWRRKSSG